MPVNYDNIPEELRWDKNWCIAGPDDDGKYKAPHVLHGRKLYRASPVNPAHWRDLETTIEGAVSCPPCQIGYVLSEGCGYTVIDMDVKNEHTHPDNPELWTSQENLDRYWKIVQLFDSYTERSAGGFGLHVWVKGDIGPGVHGRDGVEVYSRERYIVTTGDVVIDKPIEENQELLNILVAEMRLLQSGKKIELVEIEPTEDDETILKRAYDAENNWKFAELMEATADVGKGDNKTPGTYTDLGYPSQSEADLALMSIFTFYSKSNEQCRRLFRLSKLSQRPKATKNNTYLDFTLGLIRSRQAADDEVDEHAAQMGQNLLQVLAGLVPVQSTATPVQAAQTHIPLAWDTPPSESAYNPVKTTEEGYEVDPKVVKNTPLDYPPGFVGYLAQYIYENAPRPVKEVAIVAALGLMAGICGKAYTIPQSGLNLYIVLVARSAIGKEAMHSGISTIIEYLRESVPQAGDFVDFKDYASGPALQKVIADHPCFVNVSGEWGRKLKRLAQEDGRDGPMQQLRTTMTNLYQKSGPMSIAGGLSYSDKEKDSKSVTGVAYSMIGETTPGTFYEALTDNMMEDGFLSRFTIIEYDGERPPLREIRQERPPIWILETLGSLMHHVLHLYDGTVYMEVNRTAEAHEMLHAFNLECDDQINGTVDEGWRQMWNRAHLKALRISALLASADNHTFPMILKEHAAWAIDVVRRDIAMMSRRIEGGDVGTSDNSREKKIVMLIRNYLSKPLAPSYNIPQSMQKAAVVPRKFLQVGTQKITAFTTYRSGSNNALDQALRALIDNGYLAEVPKDKAMKEFNFHGKCYRVISLPEHIR